jgi:PST family polysaccharide transporter
MSSVVSKNIFWLSFSRVFSLLMLFFAYARLFRYLGPDVYGQYQFTLSYVMLFSTVVDFGIQQFIQKKITQQPDNAQIYFREFLYFETFIAAFLYSLLALIAYANHYQPVVFYAILITGLGMVANALCYPYLAVMSAFQDLRKVAVINFINSFVNISVIFLVIWLGKGIVFLAIIQLAFGLIDLLLYKQFVKKYFKAETKPLTQGRGIELILDIVKSAWPFVLLVGFSSIYNRIDVILISHLKGYEQTGYYGAAYKIFDLLAFFPAVVSHALYPFFSGLMAKNLLLEVRQNLEKYLKLMFAISLPMAVGGMILSAGLIKIIAGEKFLPAAPVLSILIWAPAILFIYIPVNSLIISQLTKKAALVTGINVCVNISGNLILMGYFGLGIKAAAIMTVVSEFLQGFFYFYFVRKNLVKFDFNKNIWQPILASAVMGVVLWTIKDQNLIVSLPAGAAVYLLVLMASGFLNKEDLFLLKKLLKRP